MNISAILQSKIFTKFTICAFFLTLGAFPGKVFSQEAKGEKFDAGGGFVRRWVPELAAFPGDAIHQPWQEPLLLASTGYPERIVRHEEQREKCLAMFKAVKKG